MRSLQEFPWLFSLLFQCQVNFIYTAKYHKICLKGLHILCLASIEKTPPKKLLMGKNGRNFRRREASLANKTFHTREICEMFY